MTLIFIGSLVNIFNRKLSPEAYMAKARRAQTFRARRNLFTGAAELVLSDARTDALAEAAFPAYTNRNPVSRELFWERIRTVVRLTEGHRYEAVMDFGCGSGVLLPFLADCAPRVVAADLDLGPLSLVENHLRLPVSVEKFDTRGGLAAIPDASLDLVTALDVLEHVEDLPGILSEMRRTLRPGGRLIVSGPTENFAYKLGRKLSGPEYSGHYHCRNIYDIGREMKNHFSSVRTVRTLVPPVPLFVIYEGRV
jgi:SAM-dependent methyltransferase